MEGLEQVNSSVSSLCKLHTTFIIDPDNFWAQIGSVEKLADFVRLEQQIHNHCEQFQTSDAYFGAHFPANQLVFVKSPRQKKWLRAEIVRTVEKTLDVFYPDYGTTELVPCTSVCQNVPPELTTPEHHAFRCQLVGIQPIAKSWTSRAIKCFKALAQDKTLDTLLLYSLDQYGTMQVALYTGENHNCRSVTHLLLEEEVGLPWGIENVPEYSFQVLPGWFSSQAVQGHSPQSATMHNDEEEELSGSDTDSGPSMNSSSSGPVARIPSFDTAAMETSNDVTLEMLKINAVMENQKRNRTEYKQQLQDLTADIASQVHMFGGPVEQEETTTATIDVVDEIHSIIRKTESSTDTDHADENLSDSKSSRTELAHKSSRSHISSPSMGLGRGRNKNRSSSNSPVPEDKTSTVQNVHVKAAQVNNVRAHSPSTGRGRGRSKNRSTSNSPVPGGHTRRSEADRKQVQDPEQFGSPIKKKKSPRRNQNGTTDKAWKRGVMSPREFNKRLTAVLNVIQREGLHKHQGDFEDLLNSNKGEGRINEILEAILDKAVRLYETFASVAVTLLSLCQNFDNFEECLSSALYKLQSKYVRIHNKQVYYYENYSKLLGDLFVSSASWNDSVCLSLRQCVVNTLDKWIFFNMKKRQPSSDPLQQLYIISFAELWGRVHETLHSTMTAQWELIVEGMKEKIESDQTSRDIRGQVLSLLLSTFKPGVTPEAEKRGPVCNVGSQTSCVGADKTTQTPVPNHAHKTCQVNLSSDQNLVKKADVLLTPEELMKGEVRNLQSPDQFVVPKFTLPISPDVLQKDAQLSPLSLTYSRGGGASQNDPFLQSLPSGRGRGVEGLASQTKPFFQLMSQSEEPASVRRQENMDIKKVVLHGAAKPQLLSPDEFTKSSHLADGQGDFQLKNIPADFTSKKSDVERREDIIPENFTNINNSNISPLQLESPRDPPNLVNSKRTQGGKKKKKQLINLSTGKILGVENSHTQLTKASSEPKPSRSPTFSYAAALGASKQSSEEKAKTNSKLSMKSIALDLLREPSEPEPSLPESGSKPPIVAEPVTLSEVLPRDVTLPTTSTPWGSAAPSVAYPVANEEFPSLKEAEKLKHHNVKPIVPIDKSDVEVIATSRELVSSEGEDCDENDEVQLAKPAPQAAIRQLRNSWKPGQRKCLICGDVNHLVYDCPNKNKNFILS
ncbi:uncharacterized protein LOC135466321 isoform X2 [Liolophura sinensis]|uniref:uncharacterized protein LOC135466321 isoform X2 n=1 Tax=Liolophura sinensis TaxID=3198878 RepID=UPI003158AB53